MSLPVVGIGPIYGTFIGSSTLYLFFVPHLLSEQFFIKLLFIILGLVMISYGCILWFRAVFLDHMVRNIRQNTLIISGAYSVVRHPVYSGILFVSTGFILVRCSYLAFVIPLFFIPFLSLLLRYTEEKWLQSLYGINYQRYQQKVPQLIPRINNFWHFE